MMVPTELFKYKNFEKYTILSLLNKGLWIPKPVQLNDPFDSQLNLLVSDVSKAEFIEYFGKFQHWYKNKTGKFITYNGFDDLFENGKPATYLKQKAGMVADYWNEKAETAGVLSLSSDPINTLMWSHYGNNHSGICIGYCPKKIFPKSISMVSDWLHEVEYKEESEITRNAYLLYAASGMWHSNDAAFRLFFKTLCTKSINWKYEKEWRYLLPENGGRVFNLNIEAITSITFGLNTSIETKTAISHLLRYHQKKTRFYQTVRDDHSAKLCRYIMDINSRYWGESPERH
ncbi:hypothetical protein CWE12_01235 [Aliidiomarina sedimenti]|uniref:DUF2971 domain-containing protein n=1 Tax=Aliidiomarina sedimenti TaxID=1933879 RepID=A0ABY0C1J4_9GAMM|nr:DUF2971 domain-containing protein [Aliidiomarina sedimenti]RUO31651.1 hypothetical protein CWE12_01235 [Aliidiomarina sedimenti]